ncbi:MAG TPA: hypothetical protein VF591_10335 [Pyrinomonadaceae bacterium]|jgi:hypothetical protein
MDGENHKSESLPPLTMGVIVESLKPSEMRSVITTTVTVIVMAFGAGVWLTSMKYDLDNRNHQLQDGIQRAADLEEHAEFQKTIRNLEDEVRKLTLMNEELESRMSAPERRKKAGAPKLAPPPKTPSLVVMPLKESP